MYGNKIIWTGLTMLLALDKFLPGMVIAGAVIMVIGLVLMWIDK